MTTLSESPILRPPFHQEIIPMKDILKQLLEKAIQQLKNDGVIPHDLSIEPQIIPTKDKKHGDYATNIALILSGPTFNSGRELAEQFIQALPPHEMLQKTAIAGPGFINFTLMNTASTQVIADILKASDHYGHSTLGQGQRVYLEYVSANPTGPLHVGHGRSAAFGASVANVLKAAGFKVHREYYVNDAGRQMQILALSIWLRYLQILNKTLVLPKNAYQGEYVIDIAQQLKVAYAQEFNCEFPLFEQAIPNTLNAEQDPETYMDALIQAAQQTLGQDNFLTIQQFGLDIILTDIREDLEEFGVVYDEWFHESQLVKANTLNHVLEIMKQQGCTYEKDGALWFRATDFGDDKDRVLIRENGNPTYFANDTSYHLHKYNSGTDKIVDVFGADHHGYVPRMKAFIEGLGKEVSKFQVLLVQFAILYRGKDRVSMSTRSGSFVTLRELRDEVGNDAARFFYIMRKPEQHLDFDLELAKSQSNENPVYYIQYAHARVASVFRKLSANQQSWEEAAGLSQVSQLNTDHEMALISQLACYKDIVQTAALHYEPHHIAHYLHGLAGAFHSYYNATPLLAEDKTIRNARLCLAKAVQQTIKNGLKLLGITAPEEM